MAKNETLPSVVERENNSENSTADLVELRAKLDTQIGELISGRSREQVIERVFKIVKSEVFRGPLPHPRHLKAYDDVVPGAADRIIKMAEDSLHHNIRVMSAAQKDYAADKRLGLIFGFISLLVLIACAMYSVSIHEVVAAGIFLGAAACGVVARFILGRDGGNNDNGDHDGKSAT